MNKYDVEITTDLKNGLYVFSNESATGKTRLAKLLRQYEAYGEPVTSYTYNDKKTNRKIEDALVPNKYSLIMLDRYDMYNGDGANLILECAKNSIVLIDTKRNLQFTNTEEWCDIEMTPEKIEVIE